MPTESPNTAPTGQETFLNTTAAPDANLYGDFFQETSDGNISIGTKAKKS